MSSEPVVQILPLAMLFRKFSLFQRSLPRAARFPVVTTGASLVCRRVTLICFDELAFNRSLLIFTLKG